MLVICLTVLLLCDFHLDGTVLFAYSFDSRKVSRFRVVDGVYEGDMYVNATAGGAWFTGWCDVEVLPDGRIAVADAEKDRILFYSGDGVTLLKSFGSEGAGASEFDYPTAVAFSRGSGKLYILDRSNKRVQVFE